MVTASPCYSSLNVSPKLTEIFHEAYSELRPRTPAPPMHVRFYPFVSINNTIRLRQGELYIRLSDLLEGAPDTVLHAIAHILLAKLYRKPVDRAQSARYRRRQTGDPGRKLHHGDSPKLELASEQSAVDAG